MPLSNINVRYCHTKPPLCLSNSALRAYHNDICQPAYHCETALVSQLIKTPEYTRMMLNHA